jgi:hypothetical protein
MTYPDLAIPDSHSRAQSGHINVPYKPGPESSVLQRIENGRDMGHQMRPYTNQGWSSNTTSRGFLPAGTETAQTYQFDQTTIGNFEAPGALTSDDVVSDYWPVEWFGQFVENFGS